MDKPYDAKDQRKKPPKVFSLNAEAVYVSIADMNSTYEYGVQYPETLQSYSEAERLDAVTKAVDKLYKPPDVAGNGQISSALLHQIEDYPQFLPGMNITFILDNH